MKKQTNPLKKLRECILRHKSRNVQKIALSTLRVTLSIIIALRKEEGLLDLLKEEREALVRIYNNLFEFTDSTLN